MTKQEKRSVIAKRCQSTNKILYAIFFYRRVFCCSFLFPRRKVLLERCTNVKFCKKKKLNRNTKKRSKSNSIYQGSIIVTG